jgi:threonine synthase
MNLRDTGLIEDIKISKSTESLSDYVKNTKNRFIDRLESFEDIMNLEVGDTTLMRSRTLEREKDIRQLYLKIEGDNPTGTQKDRIGFAQVYDALRREFDTITLATCGNYGASMALASYLAGIKCKIYIPKNYHTERISEMEKYGVEIIRFGETYEDAVVESSKVALEKRVV